MSQFSVQTDERNMAFRQWQFKEAVELEHQKQQLKDEREEFELEREEFSIEREEFEKERKEFYVNKKIEDKRAEQEKRLFDMKWKILEGELKKLAAEKEHVERQRDFYRYVNEHETKNTVNVVKGELFFCGVDSEEALKKRYKDLIKIYHPDNLNGDKNTIQEINTEYDKLKALYEE